MVQGSPRSGLDLVEFRDMTDGIDINILEGLSGGSLVKGVMVGEISDVKEVKIFWLVKGFID